MLVWEKLVFQMTECINAHDGHMAIMAAANQQRGERIVAGKIIFLCLKKGWLGKS